MSAWSRAWAKSRPLHESIWGLCGEGANKWGDVGLLVGKEVAGGPWGTSSAARGMDGSQSHSFCILHRAVRDRELSPPSGSCFMRIVTWSVVLADLLKVFRIIPKLVINYLRGWNMGRRESYCCKSKRFRYSLYLKSDFSFDEVKAYDFIFFFKALYFS